MAHRPTMKAWLYDSTSPSVVQNLTFNASARSPPSPSRPSQLLIKVLSTALNPADCKVPEQSTILGYTLICKLPASPGLDFAGEVVATHPSHNGEFKTGQRVYGCLARPREFGTTGEYILVNQNDLAPLPKEGVSVDNAACLGVAVRTAYQSVKPYLTKPEMKVFINGGSGGCGVFAIQFAKMLGAHVTVTCSTKNIGLVESLGADQVIDYTAVDVTEALKGMGLVFDLVLDHIGIPMDLYAQAHHFLKGSGTWVQVGAGSMMTAVWRLITPRFLGGGRRWFVPLAMKNSKEDLVELGQLLAQKKFRVVVDEVFGFENVPEAYKKLGTGRARGKIVVRVAESD
ncbi:NAD(P)-dependent alcohol dehydrogenase [Aspergillus puulaauensis]|uniref:Enoyl reductase (ER) domain-containing protein n=1 Tax=Aspergillus puulaauensis TaxID=1220207 RepID=A0A7R8AS99_9EURO|nr:uncharacterized protein APUU_80507S [Aspergillus puulaauensis]BCS30204.1 hypothetical protein APUU_80507S [Aspergillus puulaauensis]